MHGRVPTGEFTEDACAVHVLVAVQPVLEDVQFVDEFIGGCGGVVEKEVGTGEGGVG